MNDRTIRELNDMMDEQTGELLFLLEDQKKPLERMFASHREFKRKFTSRLELPVFINDELVTFGQTYAKENGYRIDEMGNPCIIQPDRYDAERRSCGYCCRSKRDHG